MRLAFAVERTEIFGPQLPLVEIAANDFVLVNVPAKVPFSGQIRMVICLANFARFARWRFAWCVLASLRFAQAQALGLAWGRNTIAAAARCAAIPAKWPPWNGTLRDPLRWGKFPQHPLLFKFGRVFLTCVVRRKFDDRGFLS